MAFLYVIEQLVGALLLVALLTEVGLPLALGRPLFPTRRWWKRRRALAEVQDEVDAALVEREWRRRKKQVEKLSPEPGGEETR